MSGLYSRSKGRRGEYLLRDELRTHGFEVDRVPLSGASQGFKGDLRVVRGTVTKYVEVKVRGTGFERIYAELDSHANTMHVGGELIFVTPYFNLLFYDDIEKHFKDTTPDAYTKKIAGLKKLLGGCDILAIKADRKPFIFIRFYGNT